MLKFKLILMILSVMCLVDAKLAPKRKRVIIRKVVSPGQLWVLELTSDIGSVALRAGDLGEEKIFEDVIDPVRDALDRQLENGFETAEVEEYSSETELTTDQLKYEILKAINKYDIASRNSPDSHIEMSDMDEDVMQLYLYIKGNKTVLAVHYGAKKRFYYIISLPWSLPRWFQEDHNTKDNATVQIPEEVKPEFYKSVERILKSYLPPTSIDILCSKRVKNSQVKIVCYKSTL